MVLVDKSFHWPRVRCFFLRIGARCVEHLCCMSGHRLFDEALIEISLMEQSRLVVGVGVGEYQKEKESNRNRNA